MSYEYVGAELDVFAHASNWKQYLARRLSGYLVGDVLEVGAGIGAVTRVFCDGRQGRWVCLEPDMELSKRAEASAATAHTSICEFRVGTLSTLAPSELFNAILYIDVLEHIEDDRAELVHAARHLKPEGVVCVLSPAHQALYSKFDQAIGHFRRYSKKTLADTGPPDLKLERLEYLDSFGLLTSWGNRVLLDSASPTISQVRFWDRALVPVSRIIDPIIGFRAGKSVLGVWQKSSNTSARA
jgi:SAM-dependent methyltransferase